jgi:GeoRSP system PqqD family protein
VPWRVIDTETLVVDVRAGLLYPLNSVGTRIWQLCDGERAVDEIIRVIVTEFDADEATIQEDTTHFLQDLAKAKLISIGEKPQASPVERPGVRRTGTGE